MIRALLVVVLLLSLSSSASAQTFRPSSSAGVAATLVCLLTGGVNCTMGGDARFTGADDGTCYEDPDQCIDSDGAGGYHLKDETGAVILTISTAGVVTFTGATTHVGTATFSAVTTDVTAASGEDVRIQGGATSGSVQLMSIDNITDILDSGGSVDGGITTNGSGAGMFFGGLSSSGGIRVGASLAPVIGMVANTAAAGTVLTIADNGVAANNSGTALLTFHGAGGVRWVAEQAITCAAGVAALDVQASHISIDPAGAACAVTIAETTAITIGTGLLATVYIAATAGVGAVTFPDVAGVFEAPAACNTTGLTQNGTLTLFYANKADDLFVTTNGCVTN